VSDWSSDVCSSDLRIRFSNRNEMQIKVARGFAVVAGENAEAAGVVRDRFVKTEFGRKIGDGILDCRAGPGFPIGVAASEIFLEVLENLLKLPQEIFVLCKFFQTRLSRKLEHTYWIMIRPVPQVAIEFPEQTAGGRFPCPPEIETQLSQRLQRRRQDWRHIVSLKIRHTSRWTKTEGT